MDAIAEASWCIYPAITIMATGAAIFAEGALAVGRALRMSPFEMRRSISSMAGLRCVLVGTALFGLGASWQWQQLWLLVLSLVFGGEELLETSAALYVMRWGQRRLAAAGG